MQTILRTKQMNNTTIFLLVVFYLCFASINIRQQREIDALEKRVSEMMTYEEQTRELVTDLDFYEDMRRRAHEVPEF
jgi:hypothetical protein